MIFLAEIDISTRSRWGDVFTKEFIMPTKVCNISSVCANAIADFENTKVVNGVVHKLELNKCDIELCTTSYSTYTTESTPMTFQTGSISASVNDFGILVDNAPVQMTSKLHSSDWNKNKIEFSEKTMLRAGSMLRLTYQERLFSPFAYDEVLGGYKGYKVKFYIQYS